jgi:hypothetical protein
LSSSWTLNIVITRTWANTPGTSPIPSNFKEMPFQFVTFVAITSSFQNHNDMIVVILFLPPNWSRNLRSQGVQIHAGREIQSSWVSKFHGLFKISTTANKIEPLNKKKSLFVTNRYLCIWFVIRDTNFYTFSYSTLLLVLFINYLFVKSSSYFLNFCYLLRIKNKSWYTLQ